MSVHKLGVELDEFLMNILKGQGECSKNKVTLYNVAL